MVFAEPRALCQGLFFPCGSQVCVRAACDYLEFICLINALHGPCGLLWSQCCVYTVLDERAGILGCWRGVWKRVDLPCSGFSGHREGPALLRVRWVRVVGWPRAFGRRAPAAGTGYPGCGLEARPFILRRRKPSLLTILVAGKWQS